MASRAYLLINVHAAKEAEVQSALLAFEEVLQCDQVTGDADLIALAEAQDYPTLLNAVIPKIRAIDGIGHTSTCLVL